ncbi:RraA family protein [Salipiger mucosus]|uniref:Putative 4-hydroxy-4-methyl-2-oxoglutarate aldolase n=1 Tax=Salipiger mucosus DSM 16094 TaxID=1123237 RepID=S9QFM9_9RHOB|nr:RraA family protein [Salipiger mucosus]EPX78682.1 hypothetical protein Salmuc_04264 [Salipiger mucosus DSM 16094]
MIEEPPLLTIRKDFPRPTAAQVDAFRGVPTGFVCDAMDGTGALSLSIRPIGDGRDIDCTACGPAICADNGPADLLATLAALHHVQEGDILVAGADAHQGCAAAGDRVMGMLRNRGGAGFVTDGPMRDYAGIVSVGVPAWCTGLTPASPFAKGPGTVGRSVLIGGREVRSGDMIVADRDGVVVVPFERIDEVIDRLARVRELEEALDADVEKGFCEPLDFAEMIADKRAVFVD